MRGYKALLISPLMNHLVVKGRLVVVDATGKTHIFGTDSEPSITIKLHRQSTDAKIAFNPSLGIPEAYMNGELTILENSIYDFLYFMGQNLGISGPSRLMRMREISQYLFRRFMQFNSIFRSRKHVAHHYDLTGELYELFLDSDRQYSCAYFDDSGDDLETAQVNKKQHIATKLLLQPKQRVLDIGSGWGGLAIHLSEIGNVDVTGLTLSVEQQKIAKERARERGLDDRVRFHLRDYRQERGEYDRIVSVGMFEHVGLPHYNSYFQTISDLLASDGIAVIHTIGRSEGPGATNPFIRKYIFPGGYIPALSEIVPAIERAKLCITDIEVLRAHYAETIHAWRSRFLKNWDQARDLYDERFCRMWEYYLAASEVAFRCLGLVVFQIQLIKGDGAVPITRDYITRANPILG